MTSLMYGFGKDDVVLEARANRSDFDLEADRYESEHTTTFHFNPNVARDIRRQRLLLPMLYRDAIIEHVETYSTLIILGLSGCGKSTQIQYLYESGFASQTASTSVSSTTKRFSNKNCQILPACNQPKPQHLC